MSMDDSILPELLEAIAQCIESDRVKVTARPGSNDRAWQLGHNKGLSDAASIVRGRGGVA